MASSILLGWELGLQIILLASLGEFPDLGQAKACFLGGDVRGRLKNISSFQAQWRI